MNRKVRVFHTTHDPDFCYYVDELIRVLGVSRGSIYRILRKLSIRTHQVFKRHRKVFLIDLLPYAKTKSFRLYVKRLKKDGLAITAEEVHDYDYMSESQLNLELKRPEDFVRKHIPELSDDMINDIVNCGLIPVIKVNGNLYVNPNYVKKLYWR